MPLIPTEEQRWAPIPDGWSQCNRCRKYFPRNELDVLSGLSSEVLKVDPPAEDPIPVKLICVFCDSPETSHPNATPGILSTAGFEPAVLEFENATQGKEFRRAIHFGQGVYVYVRNDVARIHLRGELLLSDIKDFKSRLEAAESFIRMGVVATFLRGPS